MFCKKAVIMSFHDFHSKFILCRNINEFSKYYDVIYNFLKSVNHEDAEVNFSIMHALAFLFH